MSSRGSSWITRGTAPCRGGRFSLVSGFSLPMSGASGHGGLSHGDLHRHASVYSSWDTLSQKIDGSHDIFYHASENGPETVRLIFLERGPWLWSAWSKM